MEVPIEVAEHRDGRERPHPLLAAGWHQGAMFDAPGATYDLNILSSEGGLEQGQARAIRTQRGERLVLISHACDITANDEKYVEALICRKHDPSEHILGRWDQNSPQYFIVDPSAAYVADARHRVKIAKDALLSLSNDGLAMDEIRLIRFVEWLTRRYDRPTVPDAIYERFHAPVYAAFQRMEKERSQAWNIFNLATNEIRLTLPKESRPPFTIGVVYITLQTPTKVESEAIEEIHRIIVEVADKEVRVQNPPVTIKLDEVPYGVLRRTQPLILDYPSWEDDDAAPPAWLLERPGD